MSPKWRPVVGSSRISRADSLSVISEELSGFVPRWGADFFLEFVSMRMVQSLRRWASPPERVLRGWPRRR